MSVKSLKYWEGKKSLFFHLKHSSLACQCISPRLTWVSITISLVIHLKQNHPIYTIERQMMTLTFMMLGHVPSALEGQSLDYRRSTPKRRIFMEVKEKVHNSLQIPNFYNEFVFVLVFNIILLFYSNRTSPLWYYFLNLLIIKLTK